VAKPLRVLALLALLALLAFLAIRLTRHDVKAGAATVADLSVVHAGVRVESHERRGVSRVVAGAKVATDASGRARLRLDDGTSAVVDRATELGVAENEISLDKGRLFLVGVRDAHSSVKIGDASVRIASANVGIDRRENATKIYAANDEIVVIAGGAEHKVKAGESATIDAGTVTVAPEKAFDDWTGGLAAPWGADGAPRRAVGELWGRGPDASPGDPGSPLTIRSTDVDVSVAAETATTQVKTTYFNGGSSSVDGDFRMALPPSAIVSKFEYGNGDSLTGTTVSLASRDDSSLRPSSSVLEWAGDGWVRGHVPQIASGSTMIVLVEYVEWLDVSHDASGTLTAEYRYPLAAGSEPPLIGEFSAKIETREANPRSVSASSGADVNGSVVRVRRPDYRPAADLVVDLAIPPWQSGARMYVASPLEGEEFSTVTVRADLPDALPEAGATVALVLDVSGSTEPAELEVSKAFVKALLDALGERDQVVVLAIDQNVEAVGPNAIGPLDAARKDAILAALSKLTPGGATDLGRALEAGADALPADVPAGLVVYVGDGWATVGDPDVTSVEARLARRVGGKPRLGAVTVGPLAHTRGLAALTRGSGPLLSVIDSSDANAAATELTAQALRPAFAEVALDLGPEVEQVYPRRARSALAGSTIEVVGRMRGRPPSAVHLKWRDKGGAHDERRLLAWHRPPSPEDVRRRWAAARVDEVLAAGRGRETATDVALRAGLITPWTGFSAGPYVGTVLEARQLDVAIGDVEPPFDATPGGDSDGALGALVSVPYPGGIESNADDGVLQRDVREAAARAIDAALPSVRACRDSRAALRPELSGKLRVTLSIDGEGRAHDVHVKGASDDSDDEALDRCVEVALSGIPYPESGLGASVRVEREILLPTVQRSVRATKCSALSSLPLPLRRGVWRARLGDEKPSDVYLSAKKACELPAWADRRALLELVLLVRSAMLSVVDIARELEAAGELESAAFLRREAVRRSRTAEELAAVERALIGDEHYPLGAFVKRYKAASSDADRLAVVQRFLTIAPHDGFLRGRRVALLEAMGKKDELAEEARRARLDPFAPAELLADAASSLRRSGNEREARRTFGELAERAPRDPWARAFLGDRLRNEGWYDDATRAYAALGELAPEDPAATIRLALAHAGAGRLDMARRLLTRVVETGGRLGNAPASALAGELATDLLAEARAKSGLDKGETEALTFAALALPRTERRTVVLVRGPAAWPALDAKLVRHVGTTKQDIPAEIKATSIGLYALAFEPGEARIELVLARSAELAPARAMKVRVDAVSASDDPSSPPTRAATELELPADGKPVTIEFANGAWLKP
jgi:tetratricopeptide (TPR) repeat protein